MPAAAASSSPTAAKAPPPPPSTSPPLRVAFTRRGRAGHHRAFAPAAVASPPKTRWSWLHATACSCAVVAAGAYAHAALSAYVDTALDRLLASLAATRLVLPWRSLVVLTLLLAWGAALLVLRALGVHAPLRLALRLLGDRVASARVALAHRRHRSTHAAATLARAALAVGRVSHGRRRRGLSTAEPEIDESDMLVVTALSAEPRRLSAPQRRASATASSLPASSSAPSSTASSTSSRESSDTVDADDEQDAQILLHPREGATGGRHQSNHIIVDDPYVSRFHFAIGYDALEKEYFLQDLGSTTGTFVFLKPDVPKRLSVDDRVRLGDSEFEVVAIDCNAATGTPFLRLKFTEGPLRGVGQTLGKTPVTLGRRSSNALCITDDASISGRHSSIAYLGDGFYLTDLQSTNGTALRLSASGVPSARRFLLHGDVFGVGANRFLVEYAHELQLQEKQRALARDALDLAFDEDDGAAITAAAAAPAHS